MSGTPEPNPLQPLRFFIGAWEGEIEAGGKKVQVRYTIGPALKGRWLKGVGDFTALGMQVEDFWGVDSESGRLVRSIFDSNGLNGSVYATGWKGDVLLWEGTVHQDRKPVVVRETIRRTGPDSFTAVWEAKTPDGKWEAYSREAFRRLPRTN